MRLLIGDKIGGCIKWRRWQHICLVHFLLPLRSYKYGCLVWWMNPTQKWRRRSFYKISAPIEENQMVEKCVNRSFWFIAAKKKHRSQNIEFTFSISSGTSLSANFDLNKCMKLNSIREIVMHCQCPFYSNKWENKLCRLIIEFVHKYNNFAEILYYHQVISRTIL